MSDSMRLHRRQPTRLPVPGILQARTLEWVAISFSNAWKWKVKVKSLSRVQLSATHGLQPTRLLHPLDFPGKCTGVGCRFLLQYIDIISAIFSFMLYTNDYFGQIIYLNIFIFLCKTNISLQGGWERKMKIKGFNMFRLTWDVCQFFCTVTLPYLSRL